MRAQAPALSVPGAAWLRRLLAPALVVAGAVALRLIYGPGHLGYDAAWALEWGREALGGHLPGYESASAPTPHPLANLVSLLVAPLGDGAFTAMMALSWLSLAALAAIGGLLGRRLYNGWVGASFAVVLLTRHLLVRETHQAVVDIPFLALVLAALLLELERPREGLRVPLLLCAAGLLRPEGWLLGFAWLAYAARGRPRREVLPWAAIVVAAPALWAASDLLITGDPLYSLHGTQDLAEQLERPRALGTAFSAVPSYLRDALGDPLVWLGLAGAAAGLLGLYERTVVPAALTGLGILGFLALGVADLPLLIRYLLVPAVMLAMFAGLLLCGWTLVPRSDAAWRWWAAGGAVCLVVLLIFVPRQYRALAGTRHDAVVTASIQDDLRRLADAPAFRAALARCPKLWVPDPRARPLLASWLRRSPGSIGVGGPWKGRRVRGLVLVYARDELAQQFSLTFPIPPAGRDALPAGGRPVAQNASWLSVEDC